MAEKFTKKSRLLYPGAEEWFIADVTETASIDAASCVPIDLPYVPSSGERLVVALPARLFAAILLPVTAPDEESRDAAVQLQLEKLGLLPQQAKTIQCPPATIEVASDGQERTVQAILLDEAPPPEICVESAALYEAAPRLVPLEKGVLAICRELGNLVALLPNSSGQLAHFQVLGSDKIGEAAAQEISLLLQAIGTLPGIALPGKICVHFEVPIEELQIFANQSGLEVTALGDPVRRLAASVLDFTPVAVVAMRAASRRRRTIRMAALALLCLVLAAVAAMGIQIASLTTHRNSLRREIDEVSDQVEATRQTAQAWQNMQMALDPDLYPIERLYLATRLLPAEGVRLTVFEQRGGSIVITGEASSTPAAIKFANDLKRSPEWGGYEFEIPQPKILPNNSAQFRITARAPTSATITTEDMP